MGTVSFFVTCILSIAAINSPTDVVENIKYAIIYPGIISTENAIIPVNKILNQVGKYGARRLGTNSAKRYKTKKYTTARNFFKTTKKTNGKRESIV